MYRRVTGPTRSLQVLWRYLSDTRLVDLLSSGELYFAHLPKLSDQFDGALTERTRARLYGHLLERYRDEKLAAGAVADYEGHREAFFVNCWQMNEVESYLMWRAYKDRGFAIRTTLERLEAAFEPFSGLVQGRVVNYVDFSRDEFEIGNVFTAVTHKDLPYRDEREFRLTCWRPDPANAHVAFGEAGVRVTVDLAMLIEAIYVSPWLPSVSNEVTRLIRHRGLECSLANSAVRTG